MSKPRKTYRSVHVPVRGGELAVGVWGEQDAPTVLAIHGLTASHKAWEALADAAPGLRIIAPDLRGRARSNGLPGPWGMNTHADDMAAVLDHFGVRPALVLGHSMGAFVSTTLAMRHLDRVGGLVLIDGGIPVPIPDGVSAAEIPQALLGPAAERLSMTFASREAYRDYWRRHPSLQEDWGPYIESYVDYDLQGAEPELRPSSVFEAVAEDSLHLAGEAGYEDALVGLPMPISFIRSPRGLLNQAPGLYSASTLRAWEDRMPNLTTHDIADVNHYTIVMARRGAEEVLAVVRDAQSRVAAETGLRATR